MAVQKHRKSAKKSLPKARKKRVARVALVKKFIKKRNTAAQSTQRSRSARKVVLERHESNPIISPRPHHTWESKATFNPAALSENGSVHLVYRAIGDNDVSVLGYARSSDGLHIDERLTRPIYTDMPKRGEGKVSHEEKIQYSSGGGWSGGCEDPRLTKIGDKVHMLYTAFDGWGSLRIALTSIKLDNFRNKKWNWKKPVLISPPGEIHKNWVMFPEKIQGKYAILHSISPKILIDYFKDLDEFDGSKYIKSQYEIKSPKKDSWDSWIRGVGPTPIKTPHGWLLLYHAMDKHDPGRYKLGAMILDLKDPTIIRYRSQHPVLEPDEDYENEGFKASVVYSCGATVKDGRLFVYYGGADTVVCVATADMDVFLNALMEKKRPMLTRVRSLNGNS